MPTIRKAFLLLVCLFLGQSIFGKDKIGLFYPPKEWQIVQKTSLEAPLVAAFIGKGSITFRPSINFVLEPTILTQEEYLSSAKEIHDLMPSTEFRKIGSIQTKAGKASLVEISKKIDFREIKMLQMILVTDQTAYIMTGTSLKNDFLSLSKDFISTFHSFNIISDLLEPLDQNKKALLTTKLKDIERCTTSEKKRKLEALQKIVLSKEFENMGRYWHSLILEKASK